MASATHFTSWYTKRAHAAAANAGQTG
jgi:hypothetical protein